MAAIVACALGSPSLADSTHPIDTAHSTARFSVQHVFVEHVTGIVPIASGQVILLPDSAIPVSASATLDATSLNTGEPDQTAALHGPDFFDVQHFPTWTFASTKITPAGNGSFGMDGLLTIHGVTQPEHLDVTIRKSGAQPEYLATAHIDRHAFGMKVTQLDPAIGGVVDVTLDINLL